MSPTGKSPRHQPGVVLPVVLAALESALDDVTHDMVHAYRREILTYAEMSPAVAEDVRRVSAENLRLLLRVLREGRPLTDEELAPLTTSARERARRDVSLDDLLHAYRIGTMVAWEALVREARTRSDGPEAALELVGHLMRFVDHVSTVVARAYLDERGRMATDEDHRHQQLLTALLGPDHDEARRLAAQLDLGLADEYLVALLRLNDSGHSWMKSVSDVRQRLSPLDVLVVRRDQAILMFWPGAAGPADVTAALGLSAKGGPGLLLAHARGPRTHLQPALHEAETVLALREGRVGVFCLEDVLLDAVIAQSGGRTTALLHQIQHSLGDDGRLRTTLAHYVASDASATVTAQQLFVHRNTVVYRLNRVRELTGLDPYHLDDLFLLTAALRCPAGTSG